MRSRKVKEYRTDGIDIVYQSITEASQLTGISTCVISRQCNGLAQHPTRKNGSIFRFIDK